MIETLLPDEVSSHDLFGDSPELFLPGEEEFVARAVARRRREFSSVRHCARQAMAALGVPPTPLLRGDRGAPLWPAGVIGSMTHCDGYRAAAVAHRTCLRSIGIDAEPVGPLPDGVLATVASASETEAFPRSTDAPWDRILFSAKESIYKAWSPVMHRWLDFTEAHLEVKVDGTFKARLLPDASDIDVAGLRHMRGLWRVECGLVVTAVVVENKTPPGK